MRERAPPVTRMGKRATSDPGADGPQSGGMPAVHARDATDPAEVVYPSPSAAIGNPGATEAAETAGARTAKSAAGQAAIPAAGAEAAGGAKAPARTAIHAKVAAAKPTTPEAATPEAAEMAAAKTATTPEAAATVTAAATPATAMTSHRVGRPRKGHSGCQENCRHTKFMIDHGHLRARGDDTAAPTWASGAFPIFACSRRQAISPSPAESSPQFSGKAMADRQHMRCDKYQGHEKPGTRLPRAPSLLLSRPAYVCCRCHWKLEP